MYGTAVVLGSQSVLWADSSSPLDVDCRSSGFFPPVLCEPRPLMF